MVERRMEKIYKGKIRKCLKGKFRSLIKYFLYLSLERKRGGYLPN
jgi:hypothetical protein